MNKLCAFLKLNIKVKASHIFLLSFAFVWTSFAQFPAPYCPVSFTSGNEPITLVQFADIDNSTSSALAGALSHEDFTAISTNVTAGLAYPITINGNTNGNFLNVITVFIDWNQDNDFSDSGESYTIGTIINNPGDGTPISTVITIPLDALAGTTRMRVVKKYIVAATSCNTTGFGQAEDYTINVAAAPICSGSPVVGAISASVATTCSEKPFNLTADVTPTVGYSYQWQRSVDNEVTWISMGTAQMSVSFTVNSQDVATFYRLVVTCTSSNLSTTSPSIEVGQNVFSECYCTNEIDYNCSEGDLILNVTFGTINNNSGCSEPTGYTNYSETVLPTTIQKGTSQEISVTVGPSANGWQYESAGVWIDFNHNGIFDVSEFTFIGTGLNQVLTQAVIIPTSAMEGLTRMRVIATASQGSNFNTSVVCGPVSASDALGEAEDYMVNIIPFLSTQSNTKNSIALYPNPATAVVTIDFGSQTILRSVGVFALSGQQILSENMNYSTSTYSLNLQQLATGVYVVKIITDSGTFTERLIKK